MLPTRQEEILMHYDEQREKEFDPSVGLTGKLTGAEIDKRITYVTNYEQKDGYVVFGMADV